MTNKTMEEPINKFDIVMDAVPQKIKERQRLLDKLAGVNCDLCSSGIIEDCFNCDRMDKGQDKTFGCTYKYIADYEDGLGSRQYAGCKHPNAKSDDPWPVSCDIMICPKEVSNETMKIPIVNKWTRNED